MSLSAASGEGVKPPLRIGVAGVSGRMGRLVAEEVIAAGAILAGGTTGAVGTVPAGVAHFADIALMARHCDLVIDFSHAGTVAAHAAHLTQAGRPWVLGTTGYDARAQQALETAARVIPIVAAANFAPAMNLLLLLAEQVAAALPAAGYDAEVWEMHHRHKVDAPSGTALALGRSVAAGRGQRLEQVAVTQRTGPRPPGSIGFASMRGGEIAGEHALIVTGEGEQITLRHQAFDRRVFAVGAVRAARWLIARPCGLYGMREVLGFAPKAP